MPRRRRRFVHILIAHWSVLTIMHVILGFFYLLEKWHLIYWMGPCVCKLFAFAPSFIVAAFALNAIAITYESVRSFHFSFEKILVCRTISLIWIVAAVCSIPNVLQYSYYYDQENNIGMCQQVLLFDSFQLTLTYEVARFFLFHILVVGYVAKVMYEIRSKIRYLYILKPIPNDRMKKKVKRVRFVYAHAIVFACIWLPMGFFVMMYKLLSQKEILFSDLKNTILGLGICNQVYLTLNAVIYICLNEDISNVRFFWVPCCFSWDSRNEMSIHTSSQNGETVPEGSIVSARDANASERVNVRNNENRKPASRHLDVSRRNKVESVSRKRRRKIREERLSDISRFSTIELSNNVQPCTISLEKNHEGDLKIPIIMVMPSVARSPSPPKDKIEETSL